MRLPEDHHPRLPFLQQRTSAAAKSSAALVSHPWMHQVCDTSTSLCPSAHPGLRAVVLLHLPEVPQPCQHDHHLSAHGQTRSYCPRTTMLAPPHRHRRHDGHRHRLHPPAHLQAPPALSPNLLNIHLRSRQENLSPCPCRCRRLCPSLLNPRRPRKWPLLHQPTLTSMSPLLPRLRCVKLVPSTQKRTKKESTWSRL